MLSHAELLELCQRLGLPLDAQAVIEAIRSSPPSRRVRSAAGNVSVRYPSRKMGVTIQAESHRNELAGIYEKEHDRRTLEYYDQPPPIQLSYPAKSGREVSVRHTPDFFVLRTDSVGWEEWKMEEELVRLADEMPHRYMQGEAGRWRCPPGERYGEPLGLFYRVRSSAEINWIFQRNLLFLEDYLRDDCPLVSEQTVEAVLSLVAARPGIILDELFRCAEGISRDTIYTLIAAERVYVDVDAAPLAEPERASVFSDQATARAFAVSPVLVPSPPSVEVAVGAAVTWDGRGWTIVNLGETTTALLAGDGTLTELPHATFEALVKQGKLVGVKAAARPQISAEAQDRLAKASPVDLQEANRRYAILAPRLGRNPSIPLTRSVDSAVQDTTSARTIRYWLSLWREAEQIHGCGYVGLLPQRHESGNRQRKLPEKTLAVLDTFIANDYETLKQKPKVAVYAALVRACEEQSLVVPSYKTFTQAVGRRPRQEQVDKRQGHRAAYQQELFYWELTLTTPRHGDRPFEIGHIDHTQLDLELVCSRTGRNLGRPWVTFLTDAFSRRLPAVYLTFDAPSYRSCMMVLRECVRRHGRLPQIIVVDGGREFGSTYFETLLARYECTKKTRPGAQARFGSVCERLFGTTNTRFIHTLTGNTQIMRNVRQVTKAVNPKEHACWTLSRLYVWLCEWAYEVYDTLDHPALGQSPREAFAAGLVQSGQRPHRLIPYDEDFRMLTLPTTEKGTAKVQPRLGVKINYIHYWSDAFRDPEVEKLQVSVRFDPFDAGTAYAFVKGHWVHCISEHHTRFAGRSEREMMLATAELRQRHQRHTRQFAITARQLADFLASLEAEEALLEQRQRDTEAKDVLTLTEGVRVDERQKSTPMEAERPSTSREERSSASEVLVIYEDY